MVFNYLKFKELRKKIYASAKTIEDVTGINQNTLYSYETGRSQPSEENLFKLAQLLHLEPADLLMLDERPEISKLKDRLEKANELLRLSKDELAIRETRIKELENDNSFLKELIRKNMDLGKLSANRLASGSCKVIPLSIGSESKQVV